MPIVSSELQIFLIICSAIFFLIVLVSSVKRKMNIKYFTLWILLAIVFVILSLFPNLVIQISTLVKIQEPVHLVFLIVIAGMLLIVFNYNYTISKLLNENRKLTQELGITNKRVSDLERKEEK